MTELSLFDWVPPPGWSPVVAVRIALEPPPPPAPVDLPVVAAPAPERSAACTAHIAASRAAALAHLPRCPTTAVCVMVKAMRAHEETADLVPRSIAWSLQAFAAINSAPAARAFIEGFA